jgi:hypothetical protein
VGVADYASLIEQGKSTGFQPRTILWMGKLFGTGRTFGIGTTFGRGTTPCMCIWKLLPPTFAQEPAQGATRTFGAAGSLVRNILEGAVPVAATALLSATPVIKAALASPIAATRIRPAVSVAARPAKVVEVGRAGMALSPISLRTSVLSKKLRSRPC